MILCTYKRFYSKDGINFVEIEDDPLKIFKTDSIEEAIFVINHWSSKGGTGEHNNYTYWKYEIQRIEKIGFDVWDDEKIPYRGNGRY